MNIIYIRTRFLGGLYSMAIWCGITRIKHFKPKLLQSGNSNSASSHHPITVFYHQQGYNVKSLKQVERVTH